MAANEGLKPLAAGEVPVDPNVRIPDHVSRGAARADAIHEQFYPKDPNQPDAPAKDAEAQAAAAEAARAAAATQAAEDDRAAQQTQQPDPNALPPLKPGEENVTADEWRHRFLSMQGRYQAQVRNNASMEEQMRQLGEELVRSQALIQAPPAPQQPALGQDHNNLITEEDRQNYGDELLDVVNRAARGAMAPELARLQEENQRLTARVQSTGKRELFATLDQKLPNWRAVNTSPQFVQWLRLRNVYTGEIRQVMLKRAVDGAEAPKVIQLFNDFLAEARATGQMAPAAQTEQQGQTQQPAPRTSALDLETLAAPGRARPASGDSQVPSEKPIYSRADIAKFYDDKRRGHYAGRQAAADAFEADLTAAQREGRIRG